MRTCYPACMENHPTCRHLTIDGALITDIASFYAQIDKVFMDGESWTLGQSLDALNDLLHGGYGAAAGFDRVVVTWKDIDRSRAALGPDVTRRFLEERQKLRAMFNGRPIADQLAELERGEGTTYFDIVMEVFADHPHVEIVGE